MNEPLRALTEAEIVERNYVDRARLFKYECKRPGETEIETFAGYEAVSKQNYLAFVLAAATIGPMIVNRMDFGGVGCEILSTGRYDQKYFGITMDVLKALHGLRGDGMVVLDGGANIGVYVVPMAKLIEPWGGVVLTFEPQQWVFYALCGNLALNNCFNARPFMAALTATACTIPVPQMDFRQPASFSGVTLNPILWPPENGQKGEDRPKMDVPGVTIDGMNLPRLDFMKLDIEGMELEALMGARRSIERLRPLIFAETVLTPRERMLELLGPDWRERFMWPMMSFYWHKDDPIGESIKGMP